MILRKATIIIMIVLIIVSGISVSKAHVPYIERCDFSVENPCIIWKMLEKSKAFYCWLEHHPDKVCTDIDVFQFTIRKRPINIYIELIVPVVQEYYEDFVPWFALVGPNLPEPSYQLPFDLPIGYGALVIENQQPGSPRDSFYEPFGGKSYYFGPILDMNISQPGTYYVYVWDPYESGGDYVLVLGKGEFFGPIDILRAIINTIIIRQNKELHVPNYPFIRYND
ncbi:MAG: hypothetical protein QCH96_06445 [Candidatus Thermoplasmatota archaeon]|nr:hypothetical protein [Candidatus Thermoplasmatota archaeon]